MDSDAPQLAASGESSWSSDRRAAHAQLLRALEQMRSIGDPRAYDALHALVDVLVLDRLTPEAMVIAIKESILRSMCLSRFEPPMRERVRSSLVAASIDRYYDSRAAIDARSPAPSPTRHLRIESRDDSGASA
jgi:hypothetical protein